LAGIEALGGPIVLSDGCSMAEAFFPQSFVILRVLRAFVIGRRCLGKGLMRVRRPRR
jgi:hypothetical protein